MSKDINWTQFFRDAGVPSSIAKRYSALFDDNRISKDMLMDLNKEILISMGITAMGDVINILKQAKKTYSLDGKKKDTVSPAPKLVSTSVRCPPPPPTAHSTTAGQAPAVSTTSAPPKKKIVAKHSKAEVPDCPQEEVAYVGYIIDEKGVVLEPKHSIRASQFYTSGGEEKLLPEDEYYVESAVSQEDSMEEDDIPEGYKTHNYEVSKLKRPMTMYSDDPSVEFPPQSKQPRVIILPGERQDIFTTSGLQKAAKVYESGEEEEGKLTTDRSRRLLESAGLIPSNDKSAGNSVFSRLDYKPSVTAHKAPASSNSRPQELLSPIGRRIINLTKTSASNSKPSRTVTSSSPTVRKISTLPQPRKVIASTTRGKPSTSLPSEVLVKRLVSSREEARPVAKRLGDRIRTAERHGARASASVSGRQLRSGFSKSPESSVGRSGLFGYDGSSRTGTKKGVVSSVSSTGVSVRSSMVADEYEYQTRRQHDIRSRLEVKEQEKAVRRGGPLGGRLGTHKVFRRLE